MDNAALYSFMARFRYGIVSSTSSAGTPQSALVGIATTPELEIVFDTVKSSRKYSNLIARPSCSFVIGGWESEQTLQFEGLAMEPIGRRASPLPAGVFRRVARRHGAHELARNHILRRAPSLDSLERLRPEPAAH